MKLIRHLKSRAGFTIVELVTVIAVISILALVTIVSFGLWRQNLAKDEVRSDLKQIASAMESSKNFSNGYPSAIPSTYKASPNVNTSYISGNQLAYCINGSAKGQSSVQYYISNTAKEPVSGSCPAAPPPSVPTISSGSVACGNNGGGASWAVVTLNWNGQPSSTVPYYKVYRYGGLVSTYTNTSGTAAPMTTTISASDDQWAANSEKTISYTLRAVNTSGVESGDSNVYTYTFPPYDC